MMYTSKTRKHSDGWMRATFGEHKIGNQAPYWSVTAEISSRPLFTSRSIHSCGCLHSDVREYFPELAPTLKWHLSTGGIPMHYVANAKFWHDMANGLVKRGEYDPDPRSTFVSHVCAMPGENPETWLDKPWPDVEVLLRVREEDLAASYREEVRDKIAQLVEALGAAESDEL